MEKRKSIIGRSILAATVLTASGFTANASNLFAFNNLGTGEEVRTNLLNNNSTSKSFELKCGAKGKTDSTTMKKGKDGKCGEGKCGEGKCGAKKTQQKGKTADKSSTPKKGA